MTETIQIGSEAGTWFALVFFLVFSVTIGYIVFALLSRPQTRRAEFIRLGAASARTSVIIGTIVGSTIYLLVCWSMLTGFNGIELDGEMLRLHYLLAPQSTNIRRDELTQLQKVYAYGVVWKLVITTAKAEKFESVVASESSIDGARVRLAQLAAE